MSKGKCLHLWSMGVVSFLMLASLTLTLVALLTDSWYRVTTDPQAAMDPEVRRQYNYHFGLWRLCYDDHMPADVASASGYKKEGSSCIFIYDQLIQKAEDTLNKDSRLRLHLSRAVLGCSIASAACVLFALLSLMCGMWPSSRQSVRKQSCVYLATALLLLLATMNSITSGVSFMAVRDLDNTVVRRGGPMMPPAVPAYASQDYAWSFFLHWTATGLVFLDSLLAVCMLRMDSSYTDNGSKLQALDGL